MFSLPRLLIGVILVLALVFAAIACSTSSSAQPTTVSTATSSPAMTDATEAISLPTESETVEAGAPPQESAVDPNHPYDEQADPKADIAAALERAQADSKLVLLDFGANWCPDCIVLAALFEDPSVKPYLDEHYHVVHIDVGYWDKNLDVSEQYGKPIDKGIPAVVVLTPDGEMVATTKAGELANARTATAQDILAYLHQWVSKQ